ncbi:MAG: Fur family transcriptional regulator [Puniceicoccaceae bacterium]
MDRGTGKETDASDSKAVWAGFLRSRNLRLTRPREVVWEASRKIVSPFTAEELLAEVRKIDGIVSLPTVYRNLPLLVEAGLLREARVEGDTRHYANDPAGTVEMKLVCRESRREESIEDNCLRLRMLLLARDRGYTVEQIHLRIEGVRRGD